MNKKKLLICAAAVAVGAAAVAGGLYAASHASGKKSVYVYSFDVAGMTDYWGDSKESYGPVRSDNIQTVMLSETQTVTEILVKEGDMVKKGDKLLSFDTTLSDLALEKKRLLVEQLKLQLQQEKARLGELLDTPPYIPSKTVELELPPAEEETLPDSAFVIGDLKVIFREKQANLKPMIGLSRDAYVICLLPKELTPLEDIHFERMREQIAEINQVPTESITEFYTVLKSTDDNIIDSYRVLWQGIHVVIKEEKLAFSFFDASDCLDYSLVQEEKKPTITIPSNIDSLGDGPYYTREELTQMIEDQRKTILSVEYKIKVAEAEYSIAQREMDDGNVYAEVDGKVVSVLTPEEAKERQQPVLKVSGGGGFYITGSISELNREKLAIGSSVTVNDYRNGGMYTGTVESVGDYPSSTNSYYGNGNPNVSYYPFTVFVEESADLVGGNYVNIQYSLGQDGGGIYLQNPFLRKEKGETFVYVRGENGRLEKRTVQTGKSVWGSYTEILSGLTLEDWVAFPYGKTVKPGAPTEEGDYSTLYNR